jgi:hypothetical protein
MFCRQIEVVNVHLVDSDAHDPLVARPYDLLGGEQIRQIDLKLVSELQGLFPFDDKNKKDVVLGSRRVVPMGIARLDDRFHGVGFADFEAAIGGCVCCGGRFACPDMPAGAARRSSAS